ncbi:hypothetical protein C1645_744824 [Glomus cerebriforme]|uniref:Uncharacterized protein n=1 Tax=Glomus cerebriforme TaxID=658196 RepID=A0A397SE46_9GLOM|nr:hypothetical protein C1645_744824 [Glomus cerebriforme]
MKCLLTFLFFLVGSLNSLVQNGKGKHSPNFSVWNARENGSLNSSVWNGKGKDKFLRKTYHFFLFFSKMLLIFLFSFFCRIRFSSENLGLKTFSSGNSESEKKYSAPKIQNQKRNFASEK